MHNGFYGIFSVGREWMPSYPEAIAHSAHGLDQARSGGVLLQLLAQPAHMDVDGARITGIVVAPDILQELITRQHGAAILHQAAQQFKLLGLQLYLLAAAGHAPAIQVHYNRASLQSAGTPRASIFFR